MSAGLDEIAVFMSNLSKFVNMNLGGRGSIMACIIKLKVVTPTFFLLTLSQCPGLHILIRIKQRKIVSYAHSWMFLWKCGLKRKKIIWPCYPSDINTDVHVHYFIVFNLWICIIHLSDWLITTIEINDMKINGCKLWFFANLKQSDLGGRGNISHNTEKTRLDTPIFSVYSVFRMI